MDNGEVYVTECQVVLGQRNCKASKGGKCSHVAALLYMIEELTFGRPPQIDEACTSKVQAWGKGQTRNIDPKPINTVVTLIEFQFIKD